MEASRPAPGPPAPLPSLRHVGVGAVSSAPVMRGAPAPILTNAPPPPPPPPSNGAASPQLASPQQQPWPSQNGQRSISSPPVHQGPHVNTTVAHPPNSASPQPALNGTAMSSPAMSAPPPPANMAAPLSNSASPQLTSAQQPRLGAAQAPSPALEPGAVTKGHAHTMQYQELAQLLTSADPQLLRQVIRDHRNICLIGSDYHTAFITKVMLYEAPERSLKEAVKEFGQKMVKATKKHIIQHLTKEDLDEVADALLSKCSHKLLDQALARRLETIPARELVNALARAERLGYEVEDIIVEDQSGSGPESVYPSGPDAVAAVPVAAPGSSTPADAGLHRSNGVPAAQPPAHFNAQKPPPPSGYQSLQELASSKGALWCMACRRPCSGPQALHHHKLKGSCGRESADPTRFKKDTCLHCGSQFSSAGGLYYHKTSQVCGAYTTELSELVQELLGVKGHSTTPVHASGKTYGNGNEIHDPTPRATPAATPTATPAPTPIVDPAARATAFAQPLTPARLVSASQASTPLDDPYASLTPENRAKLEQEMQAVEEHYGQLMRHAMQSGLPQAEQDEELAKLKNRFNTKQSMTRKKYGIRLRTRRSKAQMQNDRRWGGGSTPGAVTDAAASSSSKKRAHPAGPMQHTPVPLPPMAVQRVPLSEMGGLSNSSATAEHVDPTAFLTPSKKRIVENGRGSGQAGTTAVDAMVIDGDEGSDSGSDAGDIPASLPNGEQHAAWAQTA